MQYVSIILPEHVAHDAVESLGELGVLQFVDVRRRHAPPRARAISSARAWQLNPDVTAFQRRYTAYVRRCDELERVLRYVHDVIAKAGVAIRVRTAAPWKWVTPLEFHARAAQPFDRASFNSWRTAQQTAASGGSMGEGGRARVLELWEPALHGVEREVAELMGFRGNLLRAHREQVRRRVWRAAPGECDARARRRAGGAAARAGHGGALLRRLARALGVPLGRGGRAAGARGRRRGREAPRRGRRARGRCVLQCRALRRSETVCPDTPRRPLLFAEGYGELESGAGRAAVGGGVMRFQHIAGVLSREDVVRFERVLFRASRGNCFVHFEEIVVRRVLRSRPPVQQSRLGRAQEPIVDEQGGLTQKVVFIVLYRAVSLTPKLQRLCEAFNASRHGVCVVRRARACAVRVAPLTKVCA